MKGREIMVFWTLLASLGLIAWVVFTAVAVGVCAENEDPFFYVSEVWDATEGKLNLAGRIICATFTGIACIPAWIMGLIIFLVLFVISCIVTAFCFIFKDRSKDKEKCDGNCVECPREHGYISNDTPQIDFDSIHRDMFKD